MPATPDEEMNKRNATLEASSSKDTDTHFQGNANPNRYKILINIASFLSLILVISSPFQLIINDGLDHPENAIFSFIMISLLLQFTFLLKLTQNIYTTGVWSYFFYSQFQSNISLLNEANILNPYICIILHWLNLAFIIYVYYISSRSRAIQTVNSQKSPASLKDFSKLPQNFWLLFGIELMIMWSIKRSISAMSWIDDLFNDYFLSHLLDKNALLFNLISTFIIAMILVPLFIRLKDKLCTISIILISIIYLYISITSLSTHIRLIQAAENTHLLYYASTQFVNFLIYLLIPIISCNCLYVLRKRWKKYQPLYVTKDDESTTQPG